MTLQLFPFEFPYTVYEENFIFFFISALKHSSRSGLGVVFCEEKKYKERQSPD
jgi:hypothetical protein